jgi:hypothetical protein
MTANTGTIDPSLDVGFSGGVLDFAFRRAEDRDETMDYVRGEPRSTESDRAEEPLATYQPISEQDSNKVVILTTPRDFESANLRARLLTLALPRRLSMEGIAAPTVQCRMIAAELAVHLYNEYRLFPERIAPNVEEGITLVYANHISEKTLVAEVYNSTEIAALLNHGKTIVRAIDLRGVDDPALEEMAGDLKKL